MEKELTAQAAQALIDLNEKTSREAFATLRRIIDEPEPRRGFYQERLLTSLTLCTDLVKARIRYESERRKALQAGR